MSGDPANKKTGDRAIVHMEENVGLLKHLSLAYYANQMSVYFKMESMIAHSIGFYIERQGSPAATYAEIFEHSF